MKCSVCASEVPQERLELLPHTKVCAGCSREPKWLGTMVYGHKTGAALVLLNPVDKEGLRQAARCQSRRR